MQFVKFRGFLCKTIVNPSLFICSYNSFALNPQNTDESFPCLRYKKKQNMVPLGWFARGVFWSWVPQDMWHQAFPWSDAGCRTQNLTPLVPCIPPWGHSGMSGMHQTSQQLKQILESLYLMTKTWNIFSHNWNLY